MFWGYKYLLRTFLRSCLDIGVIRLGESHGHPCPILMSAEDAEGRVLDEIWPSTLT